MKKLFFTFIAIIIGFIGFAQNHAIAGQDKIKINIILKAQSDATELSRMADAFPTKAERRDFVVNALKHQAEESQADLINLLNDLEINGLVEEIRPFIRLAHDD